MEVKQFLLSLVEEELPNVRKTDLYNDVLIEVYNSDDLLRTSELKRKTGASDHTINKLAENDLLEKKQPPGASSYILHRRVEDGFFPSPSHISDEEEREMRKDVERLIEDAKEKEEIGEIVMEETNTESIEAASNYLLDEFNKENPDKITEVGEIIKKVKESDVERIREYDEMGWRNRANRLALGSKTENQI